MINYIYVHPLKVWDEINYPFPNLNDGTVGVWELVNSYNFILHFAGHVITYPCLGWSWSMLVKRAPKRYEYHSCIVIIYIYINEYHNLLWLYDKVKHVWYTSIKMYCSFVGTSYIHWYLQRVVPFPGLSLRFIFIVKRNIKHNTKYLQDTYKSVYQSIFQYQAFSSIYRYLKACTLFAL